jgi:hypothetical protein
MMSAAPCSYRFPIRSAGVCLVLCSVIACGDDSSYEDSVMGKDAGSDDGKGGKGGSAGKKSGAAGKAGSQAGEDDAGMEQSSGGGKGASAGKGGSGGKGGRGGSGGAKASAGRGGRSGSAGRGAAGMGGSPGRGTMGGDRSEDGASEACVDCTIKAPLCGDLRTACLEALGTAAAGPMAGAEKSDLCVAVLQCARRTGCSLNSAGAFEPRACLCGKDADVDECLAAQAPAGECLAEIQAAAETKDVAEIGGYLMDPAYSVGAAFQLLQCESTICSKSCEFCSASDAACMDRTLAPPVDGDNRAAGSGGGGASGGDAAGAGGSTG